MLVGEVMNRNVKIIKPSKTIKEAAELMSQNRIGSLVVLDDSRMVGILTERNIMDDVVSKGKNSEDIKVEDIMTKDPITITPEQSLEDAADLMTKNKIKKLPVVQNEKLVGIVTATDLVAFENKLIEKLAGLMTAAPVTKIGG